MTPDSAGGSSTGATARMDPFATSAMVLALAPFAIWALDAPVDWTWRVTMAACGGALGIASLVRIRHAAGRLRGRVAAWTAVVLGFGFSGVIAAALAFVLVLFAISPPAFQF